MYLASFNFYHPSTTPNFITLNVIKVHAKFIKFALMHLQIFAQLFDILHFIWSRESHQKTANFPSLSTPTLRYIIYEPSLPVMYPLFMFCCPSMRDFCFEEKVFLFFLFASYTNKFSSTVYGHPRRRECSAPPSEFPRARQRG